MKNKSINTSQVLKGGVASLLMLAMQFSIAAPGDTVVPSSNLETEANSSLPSITNRAIEDSAAGGRMASKRPIGPITPPLTLETIRDKQKSTFSGYVETVTGDALPVFGSELFQSAPSTFAPQDGTQVNGDYVIGSGDEIQIRGWGMVDIDLGATVDRSGSIYLPRVGVVKVAGVKYRDLQGHLKKAVSHVFKDFDLTATVAQTRAVQVYVVGNAVRPGTYTLNAMSSLLNALFSSGGPSGTGSMRNIQVKRGGEVVTRFDMYDMLIRGDKSHDISLQDGDVVYIPEVGPLVALTGNVKRSAIYELKGNTSLGDVVEWAGGFESAAELKQIIVEQNIDNVYQTVGELQGSNEQLKQKLGKHILAPGNVIRVFSPAAVAIPAQKQREFVTVAGEAAHTGVFQIQRGETLRELMARIGGVDDVAYIYAMQVTRESVRRAQQAKLDEVVNRLEKEMDAAISQRLASSTDKDNISAAQEEAERQRRVIQKMRAIKAEGRIVLELDGAQVGIKDLPDLPLRDGDSVYIPRRPDTVDVLGAVNQQSSFIYKPSRTVSDYLGMAGGATQTGDRSEMYVIRADGTVDAQGGWLSGIGSARANPGDTVVVPEKIDRSTWRQSLKEWTAILYQFGLGAAGLKVLK